MSHRNPATAPYRGPEEPGASVAFATALAAHRGEHARIHPLKGEASGFLDCLLGLLFPQLDDEVEATVEDLGTRLMLVTGELRRLVSGVIDAPSATRVVERFGEALPKIHARILRDADAICAGDPAAESVDEVIAAYPGFLAIAIHRVAHAIHVEGVPIVPRLLAEVAHARTGIDIHPGATIGDSFCIDHGTGIVIGETAVIGDDVKLYQGVTLGALSVAKAHAGRKRHPSIGNRVVIYANATVLGGDTVVADDSVIGGNVFLTSSVPAGSLVYQPAQARVRRVDEGFADADFVI